MMQFLHNEEGTSLMLPDGKKVALKYRQFRHARRITLRCLPDKALVTVSFAPAVKMQEVTNFILKQSSWIVSRMSMVRPKYYLEPGCRVMLFGNPMELVSLGKSRGIAYWEDHRLTVPGEIYYFHRRLYQAVSDRLLEKLSPLAFKLAGSIGQEIYQIRVKEVRSFFGSCSKDRVLTFSWRLVFAPTPVLEYVVAHEVAHLRHMDHSKAFWKLVSQLQPDYVRHRRWLKDHGNDLFQYQLAFSEEGSKLNLQ